MTIAPSLRPVTAADGVTSQLRIFAPPRPRTALLFHGALGVEGGYYDPFARAMARAGHAVAVVEARGLGSSSVRAGRGVDFGYRELVELEIPAALAEVRRRFPGCPCLVGGHSLGGQVAVLSTPLLPPEVAGLVLVAAGSLWNRNWTGSMRWRVRLASRLFPAVASVMGWFPGHVFRFGGREARSVMRDWSRCAITGEYRLHGSDRDWEAAAARQTRPVLAINIDGDTLAPPAAMAHLTGKMPRAEVETRPVALVDGGRGNPHFRWARSPAPVVDVVDEWMARVIGSS